MDFMANAFSTSDSKTRHKRRLLALNFVAALLVILAIAAVPTGSRVVVVAPPWSAPEQIIRIIADAEGTLVNGGRRHWLAVAEGTSPDFTNRLIAAGALLILDGRLAAACMKGQET